MSLGVIEQTETEGKLGVAVAEGETRAAGLGLAPLEKKAGLQRRELRGREHEFAHGDARAA